MSLHFGCPEEKSEIVDLFSLASKIAINATDILTNNTKITNVLMEPPDGFQRNSSSSGRTLVKRPDLGPYRQTASYVHLIQNDESDVEIYMEL